MSHYLKVTNLENNLIWKKEITSKEEFNEVQDYFLKGKTTVSWIRATLYPVRTNKNLTTDLFLPTVINHALKIQNCVGKIFAIIGATILDLATLPIRMITVISRTIFNITLKPAPMYKYLKDQGVDPKLLANESVFVKLSSDCEYALAIEDQPGKFHQEVKNGRNWQKRHLNFIEVPYYEGSEFITGGIKDPVTKEQVVSYKPRIV
jgi:hypothetical protein